VDDLDLASAVMSDDKAVWMGLSSCADVQWMGVVIFTTESLPERGDEAALSIEHLDLMAVVTGDVDVALTINTNTSGTVEYSTFLLFAAMDDESVVMSRMRETTSLGHGHDGWKNDECEGCMVQAE
jgi:hypothetical protein